MIRKTLIVSAEPSDLSDLILKCAPGAEIAVPESLPGMKLDGYEAFALLGGVHAEPLLLPAQARIAIERQIAAGKPVFTEYCSSIIDYYFAPPKTSRYERLVSAGADAVASPPRGAVLEHQYNASLAPYYCRDDILPILYAAEHVREYRQVEPGAEALKDARPCLWLESEGSLMICTFRLANFARARFAPRQQWKTLVCGIVRWLCGAPCRAEDISDAYSLGGAAGPLEERALTAAERGMQWYQSAGMLLNNGKDGVLEGVRSEIEPGGAQSLNKGLRADCVGESALPFFMRYLYGGDEKDLEVCDNLTHCTFNDYLCGEGPFKGMLRWTLEAWTVCYQDDVARAIFPVLWRQQLTGRAPCYDKALEALDFLAATTGTDGLRKMRTDTFYMQGDAYNALSQTPGGCTSPNYNAYYLAALLLAYKLSGKQRYREVAVKGMTSIMQAYPGLYRIQSETHDLCRLILPLAYLYWVTGEERHLGWLYRVADDMKKMEHPSGAYLEWDSGYSAGLFGAGQGSESAVFSKNGDPIVDCLYAVNWLPIAWLHAYYITGDAQFWEKWKSIAGFFANAQLQSANPRLNGAWARSVDVELMEIGGLPDDVGWGPWCVETGWTMSQVISGLYMGLMSEKFRPLFEK